MKNRKLENLPKIEARKRSVYGPSMAEPQGFEPWCLLGKRFSRPPRYDHFDTAPRFVIQLSSAPEQKFWGHIGGTFEALQLQRGPPSAYFIGFVSKSQIKVNRISRPPRYDRFDTAPYL